MAVEVTYEQYALGAATFDPSGLPKEYYTLADGDKNISWVQTIFQALGLRSLLSSSLKLDHFYYAVIRGKKYAAVVVRQHNSYFALLLDIENNIISDKFIAWARHFDVEKLKRNPRFQMV
ncbi:hypothetical protein Pse7367_1040 [Thalassoporum mexicanum PCC 7367]|uniref:hypothetical protein n=1 Tax=Thalassoporum mexicanum TaxID=3457544 RepID=UPI00029F96CD|nr:hypothetical protein [Pseudanabaena sp. PCC 7367]AFY69338.1 hypothetical protein Pse7367_1040 [Pseudanabaena sp. PCC 7367]